ncbi:MAG: class I SAM-dependent methyltransferase [Anaerolineales bacterium]|nr:class I SAM-dependent methyltransferase [Anaerolineales bacterium]
MTGYGQWAKNYPAQAHNPLMKIEERAMLSLLPDNLNSQVCLDLACGSGRYMRLMQSRQAQQVFGVDYSADMLAQASNSPFSINNLKLVRSTFLALPFAATTFDFITCGLAVGHEKNLDRTLAEIARVLRPGGAVIYSDFHPFATLSGWQRSFKTGSGHTVTLEHYLHLYSDHQRACQAAGLTIEAVREPVAGEYAPPGSQQVPAVLVIQAVKTKH